MMWGTLPLAAAGLIGLLAALMMMLSAAWAKSLVETSPLTWPLRRLVGAGPGVRLVRAVFAPACAGICAAAVVVAAGLAFDSPDTGVQGMERLSALTAEKAAALDGMKAAYSGDDLQAMSAALERYSAANARLMDEAESLCGRAEAAGEAAGYCGDVLLRRRCQEGEARSLGLLIRYRDPALGYAECVKIRDLLIGETRIMAGCAALSDGYDYSEAVEGVTGECETLKALG
jgi:hypothetical protein